MGPLEDVWADLETLGLIFWGPLGGIALVLALGVFAWLWWVTDR